MKTNHKKSVIVALLASAVLLGSGCAATRSLLNGALLTPNITQASTNAATGEVAPPSTNYTPNTTLVSGITTARELSPLAPAPFGWILDGVGGLALAGLTLYAKKKNGQLSTAQAIAGAVISGVEAAGHAETKAAIQKASADAGIAAPLASLVQSLTK
jgi:hypothetical protein